MKKFLTTMAVLTVIATPAFAQYDPEGNVGQITHPEDGYYNQTTPRVLHRDAARAANARAVPNASDDVYDFARQCGRLGSGSERAPGDAHGPE